MTTNLDKSTTLRAFNKHFFDFLDDIISIFPEREELIKARTSFDVIKRANPTAIAKAWNKHVYLKYKDIIDNGDITFFFEKDYSKDLEKLSNAEVIMNTINNIREPISQMNDTNKAHCAKYIQNLSKLSIIYIEMQNQ
jgi:hypothetical protein